MLKQTTHGFFSANSELDCKENTQYTWVFPELVFYKAREQGKQPLGGKSCHSARHRRHCWLSGAQGLMSFGGRTYAFTTGTENHYTDNKDATLHRPQTDNVDYLQRINRIEPGIYTLKQP